MSTKRCPECLQPAEFRDDEKDSQIWVCVDEECEFFEQAIIPLEE